MRLRPLSRFARSNRAAAIIEFALVVPILFLLVWGIISFSRAYQRMNALTSSLREGARVASTLDSLGTSTTQLRNVRSRMFAFSSSFGYPVDTSLVTIVTAGGGSEVHVGVTNYPLFAGLNFVGGLSTITITRVAIFRCEQQCDQ
jgi:Flp pilus assembly protein TadG